MEEEMTDVLANVFWSDEDDCWIATHPDCPGVSGLGDSVEQALNELDTAMELALQVERDERKGKNP